VRSALISKSALIPKSAWIPKSALVRGAVGIAASATLTFGILAAIAADAGHGGPGRGTGAERALALSGATGALNGTSGSLSGATGSPGGAVGSGTAAGAGQGGAGQGGSGTSAALGPPPSHLVVPDLVATVPGGFTVAQLDQIAALGGVRAVMPADGAQVSIDGRPASVLGVSPQAFRAWAPPTTAADGGIWTALVSGDLVASQDAGHRLGLTPGTLADLSGGSKVGVIVAATTLLGLPGVDGIVDVQRAGQLGLVANVALLINAPGADLATLMQQVLSVTGTGGRVVNLVPVTNAIHLPVMTTVPAGTPTNYLTLYQASAADYCPGLSWTVLAAIGQIESDHGANDGPSSAGALGPMQFLPSTWAIWGTDAFGQTGAPDIMNPLDAVPSAARMLCADGAAGGTTSLEAAIFDYNHADWYVTEVLDLAEEYAQEYP
jgi:Transglycosylase SLT domain